MRRREVQFCKSEAEARNGIKKRFRSRQFLLRTPIKTASAPAAHFGNRAFLYCIHRKFSTASCLRDAVGEKAVILPKAGKTIVLRARNSRTAFQKWGFPRVQLQPLCLPANCFIVRCQPSKKALDF